MKKLLVLVLVSFYTAGLCGCLMGQSARGQSVRKGLNIRERVMVFLEADFPEGVSYKEAAKLGQQAVPAFVEVIAEPKLERYHRHAIAALGVLRDSRTLLPITSYVDSAKGEVGLGRFEALLNAPLAIGRLAPYDDKALRYLLERSDPAFWASRSWNFGRIGALRVFL